MKITIHKDTLHWNALFKSEDPQKCWGDSFNTDKIFIEGDPSALLDPRRPKVAIIGTRDLRQGYERNVIYRIVETLSKNPARPVIVSGLALGTDAIAHKAALDLGVPTVAVLPTGLDKIYPFAHTGLAREIVGAKESCLLTQYPEDTAPLAINFLFRNGTISMISDLMVVPFTKNHGGGILCAKLMSSLGRQVYALPGRIDDIGSAGCNTLIHNGVAEMLCDLKVLSDFHIRPKEK